MAGRALLLLLLLQTAGLALCGLNATWVAPTVGCNASVPMYQQCDQEAACAPAWVVADMGDVVQWTLAATDPTPAWVDREEVKHCGSPGTATTCSPTVVERVGFSLPTGCCNLSSIAEGPAIYGDFGPMGFGEHFGMNIGGGAVVVTDVDPSSHVTTRVDVSLRTPQPDEVDLQMVPALTVSYVARYSEKLNNVSTCQGFGKMVHVRLCMPPVWGMLGAKFEHLGNERQHILSTPAFYTSPSATLLDPPQHMGCGVDAGMPCLSPGQVRNGRVVSTLTMSPPDANDVLVWAMSDAVTRQQSMQGSLGVRAGQEVNFTVRSRSVNEGEVLTLKLLDDPGMPIGMTVSPFQGPCEGGMYQCWSVGWTPHAGQEGRVHEVAFVAVGPEMDATPGACLGKMSMQYRVRIPVAVPVSEWVVPGGEEEGDGVVGTRFVRELRCKSNYRPMIKLAGTGEMRGASLDLVEVKDLGMGWSEAAYHFAYTPMRGDEGSLKEWMFSCGDDQGVDHSLATTVRVRTRLCSYTASEGETLASMTRRYQLSTNWLNVWNANPALTDPDLHLTASTVVKLGPTYTVRAGDTLASIAAEFSTTVKKLLAVNPAVDMVPGEQMQQGTPLCVLACTNQNSPSMNYKWAY